MPELRTDERNSRNRLNPSLGDAFVVPEAPDWHARRGCAGSDPEMFFPGVIPTLVDNAKKVCAACPVRAQCLQTALENNEEFGIFGGTTEVERRPLRAAYKQTLREVAA